MCTNRASVAQAYVGTRVFVLLQGDHDTGKTGNLVIIFSRQGKQEFKYNTGKIWTTQGIFQISLKIKYFIVNGPFID